MKFVFNVEKLKSHQVAMVRAHNLREGEKDRMSQLDQSAWFSKSERVEIVPWDQSRLNESRKLSKRKDAVEAISIVVQIGSQSDWREASSADYPEGRPKRPPPADPLAMATVVKKWAEIEFGKENVVSIELHLDESTPHVHLIVTPIFAGKLQAKKILDGAKSLAMLRASCHRSVSATIPCSYQPGRAGGEPHDHEKGAGRSRSENVASVVTSRFGLRSRLSGAVERDNEQLIEENQRLKVENQRLATVNAGLRTGGNGARIVTTAENEQLTEVNTQLTNRLNALVTEALTLKNELNAALQKNADIEILQSKVKSLQLDLSHSKMCEKESAEAATAWMNECIAMRNTPKKANKEADSGMDLN